MRAARLVRGLAICGTGVLAVLTLSGCLSLTANLAIDSDAKTTGAFAIGLQKQAASMLGIKNLGAFTSGINSPDATEGAGDLLSTSDCAASETDDEFVYTCTLTDADLSADGNPWTVTKNGNTITFSMVNKGASDDSASDLLQGGSLGQLTVNVSFPGEVTSITGEHVTQDSDTSVSIAAPLSDSVDVTVTSKASGHGGYSIALLLILVAAAAIAVGVFLVVHRRREQTPPPTDTPAPTA
jgi:hypothetical protein